MRRLLERFFFLVKILFEIFTDRATLGTTELSINLLIIMNIVTVISLYQSKTVNIPRTLFGHSLFFNNSFIQTR